MDAAIAAARRAFDETDWSTDLELRVRCLRQLHQALVDHGDEMRALTTAEAGAPAFLTAGPQYDVPVEGLRWTADLAESYAWETDLGVAEPMGIPTRRTVRREAVGVVAAITPWNFPNQINLAKVGPALLAGNTVVLKPAPDTPWVACELGRLAAEHTDLPPGVLNVVHAARQRRRRRCWPPTRGSTWSRSPARPPPAARSWPAAAPTLKKVFLELGGKSAAIVLDDADLAAAVGHGGVLGVHARRPGLRADHAAAGARASGTTRRWRSPPTRWRSLGARDPTDPGTVCGPVISAVQRDRVERYLALAAEEGGTLRHRRRRCPEQDGGFWVEPTVIAGLDNDARVAREEIFGPVLVVIPHDGDDDAVRIANDSPYGLSGLGRQRLARAGAGRRPPDPHRHPRRQRRRLVQRRRAVRRLQAVRHRPGDGRRRLRGVPRDQADRGGLMHE